jgi:tRNA(fMet)-specific endonuclease VapC
MTYLLDTSAVSDYFRHVGATYERVQAQPPHRLALSAVSEHEILYGLALKPGATRLAKLVRSFLQVVQVLPFDRGDAAAAAAVRAQLGRAGSSIGDFDALIAGVALARERILITSNVKEFARVAGLSVENWRD